MKLLGEYVKTNSKNPIFGKLFQSRNGFVFSSDDPKDDKDFYNMQQVEKHFSNLGYKKISDKSIKTKDGKKEFEIKYQLEDVKGIQTLNLMASSEKEAKEKFERMYPNMKNKKLIVSVEEINDCDIVDSFSFADIKVGTKINHKGKGVYTVVKINGDDAIVKYDDGKKYNMSIMDIVDDLNNASHIYTMINDSKIKVKDENRIIKGIIFNNYKDKVTNKEFHGFYNDYDIVMLEPYIYMVYWNNNDPHSQKNSKLKNAENQEYFSTSIVNGKLDTYDFDRLSRFRMFRNELVDAAKKYLKMHDSKIKDTAYVLKHKLSNYASGYYYTDFGDWAPGLDSAKRFKTEKEAIQKASGMQTGWKDYYEIVKVKDANLKYYKWVDAFDGGDESKIFDNLNSCISDAQKHIKNIKWTSKELEKHKNSDDNFVSIYEVDQDGEQLKNEIKTIEVKDKKIKDSNIYLINWNDTYHKEKYKSEIKGKDLFDALRKLRNNVALGGIGTANCYVNSVSPNDGYIALHGKLSDIIKEYKIDDSLIQSSSNKALQKNIATEIKSGKNPKQAAAIGYSVQRANDSDMNYRSYSYMINQYRAYPHNLRTIIRTIENADEDELSSDEKKKLIKQANQYLKDSKSVKDVNVNNIEYIQKNMKKLEQQICEYENEIKALENKNKTIDYDIQYINSKSKPSSRDDIEVRKLQTQKSNNYLRIQQLEANIVALKSDIDDVKDILKMEDYNSMFKVKVLGKSYKVKASDSYIAVKKVLKYRDRRITDENDEILNVLKSNGLKWSKVTGPDDNFYVWFESRDDAKKAVNVLNSKFGNSIKTSIITDSSTKMPKLRVQTEKQPDIIIDEEKLESALTKGLKNAKLDPEEYMIYNVEIYKDGIAWDLESALPRNAKNAIVSALKSADRGVKDVKIVGNGNTIVILTNRGYAFEI